MKITSKLKKTILIATAVLAASAITSVANAAWIDAYGNWVSNVCWAPSGAYWVYPVAYAQPVGSICRIASTGEYGVVN
jgi:hypothetical protein